MAALPDGTVVDDVWKACAYGDMAKLRQYVAEDPTLVNAPDKTGFVPLQWAALNNRVAAAAFLIEKGAAVNATDGESQTAMHWACVRGSLPTAECLLRNGARLDILDSRGYTPTHVAAQYGHTGMIYHFKTRWDADVDAADGDGRTPLHWAAYKGFPDAVKLLLFCEADVMKQDSEGCTPLHWAAIRGKAEAAHTLAQAGGVAVLSATDADGNTPPQLATDKGHAGLGGFLAKTRSRLTNKKGKFWREKGMAVACFALIVGLVLTFATRVMLAPGLPPLTGAPYFWSLCVIALASYGLYVMYKVSYCDPGFVKIGHVPAGMMRELDASGGWREDGSRAELTPETRRLHHPELKAGNWSALCTTCKIVKPWGVKHCSTTNRCVYRFDHYCPWMGNVIGKKNHRDFLIFLCLENAAMAISFCVALGRLNAVGPPMAWWTHAWIVIFLIWDACVLLPVLGLAAAQTHQAMENITTNELANAHRYAYLRDEHGKFRNPFDRGSKLKNLAGFCAQRNDEEKTQARWAMNKSEMEGLIGGGGRGGGDSMV